MASLWDGNEDAREASKAGRAALTGLQAPQVQGIIFCPVSLMEVDRGLCVGRSWKRWLELHVNDRCCVRGSEGDKGEADPHGTHGEESCH